MENQQLIVDTPEFAGLSAPIADAMRTYEVGIRAAWPAVMEKFPPELRVTIEPALDQFLKATTASGCR